MHRYIFTAFMANAIASADAPFLPPVPTVEALVAWLSHNDRNGDFDGLTLEEAIWLLDWVVFKAW